jgi:uncharacterized protein (DUF1800 family)
MNTREKIGHVLRRIGLGASRAELDSLEPLGFEKALDLILHPDLTDEGFDVEVWEFCHEANNKETYVDGPRFAMWWSLRLLITQRPFEQRMALFWHNHFAVGIDKVELGPMLGDYLEVLRTSGLGKFKDLLTQVAKTPAMLRYLDGDTSVRRHPNENFARELFELFTVGPGHYTEQDIREGARAFTGWGSRYLIFEGGGEHVQDRIKSSVANEDPMVTFSFSPTLHDAKTVFGTTKNFDGDELLAMVADRPETAQFICRKLWRYLGSPKENSEVLKAMTSVWSQTGGDIRSVVMTMVNHPAFWQDDTVRSVVKSPLEFVIPIARQLNVRPILVAAHTPKPGRTTPIAKTLKDSAGLIFGMMAKQGLMLFYPPNVGGWPYGEAWVTQNNMVERVGFGNLIFGVGQPDQPLAGYIAYQIHQRNPQTDAEAVGYFLDIFDAPVPIEKRSLLTQAFTKEGGLASFKTPKEASASLGAVARLYFGSPEFQFC